MKTTTPIGGRTEEFRCEGPAELDIRIRTGRIEVTAADVPHVRVSIAPEPEPSGDGDDHDRTRSGPVSDRVETQSVDETALSYSERRRRLVVRAPRSFRRAGIAVLVEAPKGSRLTARAHRGSIAASGVLAGLTAAAGRGGVTADAVEGPVEVSAGSGNVGLGRVSGRLRARLGTGDVEIASVDGDGADITAGTGDIWLGVVRCDTKARSGRGSIVVAEVGGGDLELVTGNGNLQVGVRPGVAAELDLLSGSGRARSELSVSDEPPAGGEVARIRMRTGTGEAVVVNAAA